MKNSEAPVQDSTKIVEYTQKLHGKVSEEFYYYQKFIFGKMATIIDATYSDPNQRQSQKDLLSEVVYNDRHFTNVVRNLFDDFGEAHGFKLYKELDNPPLNTNIFTEQIK